jgi:hypothetical protein
MLLLKCTKTARILLANLYQSSRSTFLAQIFHAFLPSKKAYEMYQFRHWGVRQQYPPVICTRDARGNSAGTPCRETQSRNECRVGD